MRPGQGRRRKYSKPVVLQRLPRPQCRLIERRTNFDESAVMIVDYVRVHGRLRTKIRGQTADEIGAQHAGINY